MKNGYKLLYGEGMSLSDQAIDDLFAALDTDNSGTISYNEFVAATLN